MDEATRRTPSLGFVGLGSMGRPMARNLARAGFALTVWRRDASAPLELEVPFGEAANLEELGAQSSVLALCVTDGPDVEEILFGPGGAADAMTPGSAVVDFSTISPSVAESVGQRLAERGIGFVDAPVTGGTEGADRGTLSVLVGGEVAVVSSVSTVLSAVGSTVTHLGPVGSGQRVKAINQVILAGTYLGVAEGVVLALKSGLDAGAVMRALEGGAAGSWVLANRSSRMIDDAYPLGFKLALHRKDLGIGLEVAARAGATLPIAAIAASLEDGLIAQGYGDDDNSALARAIRRLSGL